MIQYTRPISDQGFTAGIGVYVHAGTVMNDLSVVSKDQFVEYHPPPSNYDARGTNQPSETMHG